MVVTSQVLRVVPTQARGAQRLLDLLATLLSRSGWHLSHFCFTGLPARHAAADGRAGAGGGAVRHLRRAQRPHAARRTRRARCAAWNAAEKNSKERKSLFLCQHIPPSASAPIPAAACADPIRHPCSPPNPVWRQSRSYLARVTLQGSVLPALL